MLRTDRISHGAPAIDAPDVMAHLIQHGITLDLCPTSNVNTGVCASIAEHPIGMLRRLRFRVTLNTDNQLMSDTSMSKEMQQLADSSGWGIDDFEWVSINAMKSAFAPFPERLAIINGVIKPRYAAARAAAL